MRVPRTCFVSALLALCAIQPARAQGVAAPCVVRNVRLAEAADAPRKTLVLRHGRIEAILDEGAELPKGARIVDANGALAVPAFIDAYSFAGCVTPSPLAQRDVPLKPGADVLVDMRDANRKGIAPEFAAAEAFKTEGETDKRFRSSGFGAWLAAPHGEFLSGTSALVVSRDGAPRDRVRQAAVFQHAGFEATGGGYPGTLMGAIAQLRQFFLDARWVAELARRQAEGKPGRRPPYDAALSAVGDVLAKKKRVVCEAESANDIERWIALADEFGFELAIAGGREAWRRTDVLKARGIPVFLTLQWGEEVEDPAAKDKAKEKEKEKEKQGQEQKPGEAPKAAASEAAPPVPPGQEPKPADPAKPAAETPARDAQKAWTYEEPLRARTEKRRLWEEQRDCALRLHEAGVTFAFGSGKDAPKDLLERVRTLVEKGLPAEAAQRALTSTPAELCGVGRALGAVEPGRDATFALWSKAPLASKDAKLVWLFVDGFAHEFELESNELKGKPDEGVDGTGNWTLVFDSPDVKPASAELVMSRDGVLRGTLRFKSPFDDSDLEGACEGQVAGKKFKLAGRVKVANFEAEVAIEGEIEKNTWRGSATWKWSGGENTSAFKGERTPKAEPRTGDEDGRSGHGHDDDGPHGGGR